ncbi:hypothetical protein B296_00031480 [Ensete ventricosum]|uniref:Uncharacterized protein n=1 Tax=Ensete ventricosum TaxID=4639 RepID=A0A427AG58_ENSVE|nr:hypothetical protein B296_00031480 [Ensete ventricosum]
MVLVDRVASSGTLEVALEISLRKASCGPHASLPPMTQQCTSWRAGASRCTIIGGLSINDQKNLDNFSPIKNAFIIKRDERQRSSGSRQFLILQSVVSSLPVDYEGDPELVEKESIGTSSGKEPWVVEQPLVHIRCLEQSIPILGGREGSLSPKVEDRVYHMGLLPEVLLGVGRLLVFLRHWLSF